MCVFIDVILIVLVWMQYNLCNTHVTLTSLASGRVRDRSTNRSTRVDASLHSVQRLTYAIDPESGFSGKLLGLFPSKPLRFCGEGRK